MGAATAKVALVSNFGADRHDTGPGHPERPDRLRAAWRGIESLELGDDALVNVAARAATPAEIGRAHADWYVEALHRLCERGGGHLDPDTVVSAGSWDTALLAAGAGLAAMEALREGRAETAFVAVRPPGHHANRERGSGFCLFNNIAVLASALAEEGERVLIVDWDVHHGNGTQDIFWDDPRVCFVSTHQWPFYPGTGAAADTGGAGAPGLTVNLPLPAGATGEAGRAALELVAAPVIDGFSPTWVLVSAGYDAHRADPLAELRWSAGDYCLLGRWVRELAPGAGRLVAFLEGGYDLAAVRDSVAATVAAWAGFDWKPEDPTSGGDARAVAERALVQRTSALARGGAG